MMYFFSIILILYLIAMVVFILGFFMLPSFSSEERTRYSHEQSTKFSVIIPFRNEAANLPKLLNSIKKLEYPSHLFEVLLVDDASEDNSRQLINETLALSLETINFRIIKNERRSASPKKDAITAAIGISTYPWIITTDADCALPPKWLSTFDVYIQIRQPVLVSGPVAYASNTSLVQKFQKFDGLSLQLATIGSFALRAPLLCNGANLAYTKEAFEAVGGFSENNHIASGDDIFILEKIMAKSPEKVHFLKSQAAIVTTEPETSWSAVVNQRIRWASKTAKQSNWASKGLGMLVFLTNLVLLLGWIYCFFVPYYWVVYFPFLFLKVLADFTVIKVSSSFFKSKTGILSFLLSAFIYPLITIWVVLGSFSGKYSWKGRKFEKQT